MMSDESTPPPRYRRPESVLVVVYTCAGTVLLLKRADHPGFWQSVTGAMRWEEVDPRVTAARELREETGIAVAPAALRDLGLIRRYPILPAWRRRYAPEATHNTEHAFALELSDEAVLATHPEHGEYGWFSLEAAAKKAASWTDRDTIIEAMHGQSSKRRDVVVLLHGLWCGGWCMVLLARRLRRAGFEVHCFSYPSVGAGLRDNATRLHHWLARLSADTVHFVGHSLGGVVVRALFHYFPQQRPGRVVLLASPYRDIATARALARGRFGRRLLGASVQEMLAGAARDWTLPARAIGVISGTVPFGLGRWAAILAKPNDGVVSTAETTVPGARAHAELSVSHSGILVSSTVAAMVARFLRHGCFETSAVGSDG